MTNILFRVIMSSDGFEVKIGPPRLTKYEHARIIGARALMLSMGAPPFVEPSKKNEFQIAEEELRNRLLPIIIRRTLPNGDYQDIPVSRLQIPFF